MNLVFSDISLIAIFAEITENECIIERHLCDIPCDKALIWPILLRWAWDKHQLLKSGISNPYVAENSADSELNQLLKHDRRAVLFAIAKLLVSSRHTVNVSDMMVMWRLCYCVRYLLCCWKADEVVVVIAVVVIPAAQNIGRWALQRRVCRASTLGNLTRGKVTHTEWTSRLHSRHAFVTGLNANVMFLLPLSSDWYPPSNKYCVIVSLLLLGVCVC